MNIYRAGSIRKELEISFVAKNIFKNRLLSFHYLNDLKKYLSFIDIEYKPNLIVDSGAFSSWSKGDLIDFNEYIRVCETILNNYSKNLQNVYFVNLDVIPGSKNITPTADDRLFAVERGLENLSKLLEHIPRENIIHVFHMYEPFNTIDEILNHVDYIGISPANDASQTVKRKWMRNVFDYLPKGTKTHGFAVTSRSDIKEFPWYSVDSATWIIAAGMGNILTPFGNIAVSNDATKNNDISSKNYHQQKGIIEYFKEQGHSIESLRNDMDSRAYLNAVYFDNIEKEINSASIHHHQKEYKYNQSDLFGY